MYFLLLALLGLAAANPLAVVETLSETNEQLALRYNLPRESYPTFYDVQLYLNPDDNSGFRGYVTIRLFPNQNTQQIVLHAMEMVIENIEIFTDGGNTNLYSSHTLATDDTHLLRINTNQALVQNQAYIVNIAYFGQYAANMFGIYVSTYSVPGSNIPANLITSQLQPTFARRAFPCYDEPSIKAIFRTTIYAPPGYPTVRSNMPQRTDPQKPDVTGWVKFEFEDTPVMSTYLIAYLVSNFQYIDNTLNPIYRVPFRIYSRPGTQNTGAFALTFGQENMIALEDYTEFPYAFPKMDKVAAPDFAAGAMENWGLVIYREVALLYTEGVTTTSVRQNIGRIICHENMHMWFGNEVGPWSWTYTWLNEGFANFFENYATDFVRPQWRMMDQYVIALQNVFQSDAVLSVNPMTHPVFSPSQVLSTFNAVAYQKSGSVIRMLQHILTPEVFRQGLVFYIQTLSRSAARPEDLYVALQTALDQSNHSIPFRVQEIMDRWTNQGGFPVITAIRDAPSANSITVTQERFLTDRSLSSSDRWIIPVNYVISTNPDFSDTAPQNWVTLSLTARSVDIPGLAQADWYILNKQQTGYYRVNYDERNWGALAQVLNTTHNVIHVLNRAQLIDDSFNLARNGRLNYGYPLEISRYLVQEQDYIPWAAANAAFNYLDVVLAGSDVYDLWQRYVLDLTAPLYQSLGFQPQTTEEHVTAYHRTIVLNLNCRYGNAHCVSTAETILNNFVTNNMVPHPDIQTTVYCSGLRGGSAQMYSYLWQQYLQTTDSSLQSIFLNALGCTSNNVTRAEYLQQVIDVNSPVREQDRHTIVVSTINASPENMEEALDFVVENFHLIQPRVQGLTGTTNILNAFSRRLTTQAHALKIDELVTRHISIFTAGEMAAIAAIRENIAASITWNSIHSATVTAWLQNHFDVDTEPATTPEPETDTTEPATETPAPEPDSANVVTSSVVVFMTIFTVVFNY